MADQTELDCQTALRVAGLMLPSRPHAVMLDACRSHRRWLRCSQGQYRWPPSPPLPAPRAGTARMSVPPPRARTQDYGRVMRERLTQRLCTILTAEVNAVLGDCDAILCAPKPGPPPRVADVDEGPWRRQQSITAPFNIGGYLASVVPAGFSSSGLSLAPRFVGHSFEEALLLRVAHACEQATE